MKKHKSLSAIQTEIRRWENQYVVVFERSDLKGLARIKQKLDQLKAEYNRLLETPDPEGNDIDILSRRKGSSGHWSTNESKNRGFDVLHMRRVKKEAESEYHKVGADTFFSSLLNFCCPACHGSLWISEDKSTGSTYECMMGHRYNKEEMIIWFSEKMIDAMKTSLEKNGSQPDDITNGSGMIDGSQELTARVEILKALTASKKKNI